MGGRGRIEKEEGMGERKQKGEEEGKIKRKGRGEEGWVGSKEEKGMG